MMPIDEFINQLIQSGLADSFLDVINEHYLKVVEIYHIVMVIGEENVKDICCDKCNESDALRVTIFVNESIPEDIIPKYDEQKTSEFIIQTINCDDFVEITIINNYESEEEIYENRFNGRRTPYTHKWS